MKRAVSGLIVLGVLAALLVLYVVFNDILLFGATRTPELLGDAPAVFWRRGDRTVGITWNGYAGFMIEGENAKYADLTMWHLWGGEIGDYDTDTGVPMKLYFPDWPDWRRARGEIYFRYELSEGAWRKACVRVLPAQDFPENCRYAFPHK